MEFEKLRTATRGRNLDECTPEVRRKANCVSTGPRLHCSHARRCAAGHRPRVRDHPGTRASATGPASAAAQRALRPRDAHQPDRVGRHAVHVLRQGCSHIVHLPDDRRLVAVNERGGGYLLGRREGVAKLHAQDQQRERCRYRPHAHVAFHFRLTSATTSPGSQLVSPSRIDFLNS